MQQTPEREGTLATRPWRPPWMLHRVAVLYRRPWLPGRALSPRRGSLRAEAWTQEERVQDQAFDAGQRAAEGRIAGEEDHLTLAAPFLRQVGRPRQAVGGLGPKESGELQAIRACEAADDAHR